MLPAAKVVSILNGLVIETNQKRRDLNRLLLTPKQKDEMTQLTLDRVAALELAIASINGE